MIARQKEIDQDMQKILAYDHDLALEKATALNMHLQKEALGYAKEIIAELKAYIADDKGVGSIYADGFDRGQTANLQLCSNRRYWSAFR